MSRGNAPKEKESNKLPINPRQYTILSPEQVAAGRKSYWDRLEITGNVRNLGRTVCDATFLTALYLNDQKLIRLPPDICRLVNLKCLDVSNNRLVILPPEIGEITTLEELLLSNNQLHVLPFELGKLFNLHAIELDSNPLSPDLVSIYTEMNGTQKLLTYMLNNLIERTPSPDDREWVTVSPLTVTKPVCHFSVMCYNVLCSKYATRQMYGYCPPWALEWEYRKKGIITEIRKYDTDIITLQEVETDAFFNFFLPELKKAGYDGIFSPKSRAKHMQEKEKKFVDGCAIFYRTSKFTLVKEHLIEFTQLAMANHDGSEDMLNRVMPKDNIGLAALLQTKPGAWSEFAPSPDKSMERQTLLVCTAHIHWDPEYCDVKLIQTIMLMTEVRKIVQSVSQAEESSGSRRGQHHRGQDHQSGVHLLLCGDLNSLPESGVVEFLTHGQVSMDHQDFKGHGYKNSLHKLAVINKNHSHSSNSNLYTHSFRLRPAYDTTIMPYTNYTYEFKGIIDYIFHSSETMATIAALGPINPDWFKNNKVVGCPHPHVPSDHFPLVVQLEMCPYGSSIAQPPPPQQQQGHLGHGMGGPHGGGHHLQQHQSHHSHYGSGGGAGGMHPGMGGGPKNNGSMHR